MPPNPKPEQPSRPCEIAIVGNDLVLAALPARAVQLAHAIHASGFDLVVPVSWGEELLAEHVMQVLKQPGRRPLVQCSCPLVRQRLLASGNEMLPHLLLTVSPPVAAARYLRALQPEVAMHITYLGACAGAMDDDIDVRVHPADFLRYLERRGISLVRQPSVFESVIPPDRRRHWSIPGGVPALEVMQSGVLPLYLRVGDGGTLAVEIADHILAHDRDLIDVAAAVGCACAGAAVIPPSPAPRESLIALEPPRSPAPVVDTSVRVALDDTLTPPAIRLSGGRKGAMDVRRPHEPARLGSIAHGRYSGAGKRRFAVTPAGVGALSESTGRAAEPATPAPSPEHPSPPGGSASPEAPAQPPIALLHAPIAPPIVADKAPSALRDRPISLSTLAPPAPGAILPIPLSKPALPNVVAPTPPIAAGRSVNAPHRTPVYGVRLVARAAALARASTNEPPSRLPRAYAAMRPRIQPTPDPEAAKESVREHEAHQDEPGARPIPPEVQPQERVRGLIAAPNPAAVRPLDVAGPMASVLNNSASAPWAPADEGTDLHTAAQRALRARLRALPPPDPPNPRRLWGLLASVILIAALALLLFVVFWP